MIGELHGQVRAERIERTVREIDEAAERKDQRQAERDQQVVRADQQAVDDLLDDLNENHAASVPYGADRDPPARSTCAATCVDYHAGIVQLFSSFVGAITSRLWFAPGTGAEIVNRSHLSLTSAAGLKRIVYISCISW